MARVKVEICVPDNHVAAILTALESAGAGQIGRYDRVTSFWQTGGTWRPMPGAEPFDGEIGTLMQGTEMRVESECEMSAVPQVLKAVRAAHPYEEPIIRFIPLYQPTDVEP
ncbi:conserved hypothetical protein [Kribbella flavida DSM 17836]|uniref:CutA1 divalent ion tolerance protein n=1 Tax=Kribbella flavida (strain DSM 17836 / JCM 10339 / NBRC 14399) TaxID=479435 RepID=D2PSC5_KRIFD|nr:hypothetical protein [Kribbella flavida]ADB31249.1 conserved hypothetical protein [Kribbella flavida DSM 17836]